MDRCLHQRRTTDRTRHLQCRGLVNRTLHLHFDQTGRPFAIPRNGLSQLLHGLGEALLQNGMVLLGQRWACREGQNGVVGAGVSINGDGVEGTLHLSLIHI